jgi:hypothetical protein
MIIVVILTFAILFLGALFAVGWARWYPKTRCMAILKSSDSLYNVCIRNKSHVGPHMTAEGRKFVNKISAINEEETL